MHTNESYTPTESDEDALAAILAVIRRYGLSREGVEHVLRMTATHHAIDFPGQQPARKQEGGVNLSSLILEIVGPPPGHSKPPRVPSPDEFIQKILDATPPEQREAKREALLKTRHVAEVICKAAGAVDCPPCHFKIMTRYVGKVERGEISLELALTQVKAEVDEHKQRDADRVRRAEKLRAAGASFEEAMNQAHAQEWLDRGLKLAKEAGEVMGDASPGVLRELREAVRTAKLRTMLDGVGSPETVDLAQQFDKALTRLDGLIAAKEAKAKAKEVKETADVLRAFEAKAEVEAAAAAEREAEDLSKTVDPLRDRDPEDQGPPTNLLAAVEQAAATKRRSRDPDDPARTDVTGEANGALAKELLAGPPPEKGGGWLNEESEEIREAQSRAIKTTRPSLPDPMSMHGAADGFGGSDEGSHYMNSRQGLGE